MKQVAIVLLIIIVAVVANYATNSQYRSVITVLGAMAGTAALTAKMLWRHSNYKFNSPKYRKKQIRRWINSFSPLINWWILTTGTIVIVNIVFLSVPLILQFENFLEKDQFIRAFASLVPVSERCAAGSHILHDGAKVLLNLNYAIDWFVGALAFLVLLPRMNQVIRVTKTNWQEKPGATFVQHARPILFLALSAFFGAFFLSVFFVGYSPFAEAQLLEHACQTIETTVLRILYVPFVVSLTFMWLFLFLLAVSRFLGIRAWEQ